MLATLLTRGDSTVTREKNFQINPVVIALSLSFLGAAQSQAAIPVFINEIHYDNVGTDISEAVEIAGPAGTDLTGWRVIPYNGNGGASYTPAPTLSGAIPNQNNTGFGTIRVDISGLQNGAPDGVALVNASNQVVQFLSYEGSFTASNGPASGLTSTNIGVTEGGEALINGAVQSLQLTGTGTQFEDFAWSTPVLNTLGAINGGQTFSTGSQPPVSRCGLSNIAIHDIQGTGASSPLQGTQQEIEAVVTGSFQGSAGLGGFYAQEPDAEADADATTSEGIFVASATAVNVGDRVHVLGTVGETFGLTRLEGATAVNVCSTGNALPAIANVTLPFDPGTNNAEWREGMRVNLPQTLTVSENFNLARFGELVVSSNGRLITPTQVAAPGAPAVAFAAQNQLNRLIIDDGSNIQNPDPVIYPQPAGLSAANTLREGYTLTDAQGILTFDFGAYRLEPTQALSFVPANVRSATPPPLPGIGSLKVASFNILNYFNGNGTGGGFPTSRGATTAAEFTRQRDKIINAITNLNADIVGLIEVENDGYTATSAIADLVNGLNAVNGPDTYRFVNPGVPVIGTDEIAVGLIYKPAKVALVGASAILDASVNPNFIDTLNRPALAQTFRDKTSNKRVTVAVNHLKSKGSDCNAVGDPDILDGQGNCNQTRTSAAIALGDWLNGDPTGSGEANYLIIGDLNSYAQEDPISALNSLGFANTLANFTASNGGGLNYSFVFNGESGTLDYALANPELSGQVLAAEEWHINADEPRALDYNVEFKSAGQVLSFYNADPFRASDHDPLLVELFVPGDLDKDGDVDNLDFNVFRSALGKCNGSAGFIREADYDNSQCITNADYRTWYRLFNAYLSNIAAQ
ncbi:MAG: hypothetical protein CTY18_10575 [Methylomonas sp.]|nr:MAG: hypothetical protein CTY24_06105 [Methylobacter sp.]PPD32549.1 MAG: hypothetical protein CTY18_10575 [Methylomonas sp.]